MEIEAEEITNESIQKLLEYLPYFVENNRFEKIDDSGRVKGLMEYPEYTDEVESFIKTVYATKFLVKFAWMKWDEGRQLAYDSDKISKSSLLTLRMLLTTLLRSERFSPGSFLEALEYGVVREILHRLQEIAEDKSSL